MTTEDTVGVPDEHESPAALVRDVFDLTDDLVDRVTDADVEARLRRLRAVTARLAADGLDVSSEFDEVTGDDVEASPPRAPTERPTATHASSVYDVTSEFVVDDAPGRGRVTVLVVTWRSTDPLAVGLALVTRPDHPALPQGHWVMSRDALRAGLEGPVGEGDVRVTPRSNAAIMIELIDGDRRTTVALDAEPLRVFLERTEGRVPSGQEHPELALDAVLEELRRT